MLDKGKRRVMAVGDNPNTTLSYGILMDYLTRITSDKYQWNIIVNGYTHGIPEVYGHWIKWPSGKNEQERDTNHVPNLIDKLRPELVLSIGDWNSFRVTRYGIPKTVPWIHWLPIDHHDSHHLTRSLYTISLMDFPVMMSKYSLNFVRDNGLEVKHCIYPFVQTAPLESKQKKGDFGGFKEITEKKELESLMKLKKEVCGTDNKKVLLCVCRPGWRKNLQMLIGAFKKLISERERKDVVLYLHTDPNDPCSTFNMGKEIHAQGIPIELIKFSRELSWDKGLPQWYINGLYNLAKLSGGLYITSHGGEGFGIPIAEAMACKVPFVATDCTTTPELGKDEDGFWKRGLGAKIADNNEDKGVFRPYIDIDDFCDKIEFLLDHDDVRKEMGENGRKWVVENCSVPVIRKKWLDLLDMTSINKVDIGGLIDV